MITWMQRHKKYLVVTIWISVIAFVGAGFVGWGAYDFNSDKASAVAKVGDRKITVKEFQLAYANHFNFYKNTLGGKLTQEQADEMGLEKIVMDNIMNEALLLSYADEIGLQVLESEVIERLRSDEAFIVDGKFSKETYYNTMKRSGLSANEYEDSLKKQILLEKLQSIFDLPVLQKERAIFNSAMFMKDKLSVSVLTLDADEGRVSEEEAKDYWEENKANYLTQKSYSLDTIEVIPKVDEVDEDELQQFFEEKKYSYKDSEGKLQDLSDVRGQVLQDFKLQETKREALETYLLFKKSQMEATNEMTISANSTTFPVDKLEDAKTGEVLKPIEMDNSFLIVKLTKINNPVPKSFEAAKSQVMSELRQINKQKALEEKAKSRLNLFAGKNIGFVSKESTKKIPGLTQEESVEFVNAVFDSKQRRDYVIVGEKAVLYNILEQDLLTNTKAQKYNEMIDDSIVQMKQAELNQNLISLLNKRYETEQYYKGN